MRASDRRALFVGTDAYEAAGGVILRDLFEHDDGGWLQDPALLDSLVTEKLKREAENLSAEGWKWIAVAIDFPYGHANGLRRLIGEIVTLTEEEQATREAVRSEYDRIEEQYAEADELPDEIDQHLGEIEIALAAFENRLVRYDPSEIARAGGFVSIDRDGELLIERGFIQSRGRAAGRSVFTGRKRRRRHGLRCVEADGSTHGHQHRCRRSRTMARMTRSGRCPVAW